MKIFGVAIFTALLTIAYSKGSGAEEPSQLIAKKNGEGLLNPENALVGFMSTQDGSFFGGGALLSKESAITPFSIFRRVYGSGSISGLSNFAKTHVRAVIGLNPFEKNQLDRQHSIVNIKHNVGPDCLEKDAFVLVITRTTSIGGCLLPPSWVQHIPIASQSYPPGKHSVSESLVAWDEELFMRNAPISSVFVDPVGIIATKIPMAYREEHLGKLDNFLGGFVTRGGILTGMIFKQQLIANMDPELELWFLPINGNIALIKDSEDKDIKIIDVDSAAGSNN